MTDLPGTGNFLVFDNGNRRLGDRFSQLVEIDPYDGPMEDGAYVPETAAGYLQPQGMGAPQNVSKQIVWTYRATLENAFYSNYISGAQRLPNGNTLVCSGAHGHFFEVTSEGDVVWEYISPVGDQDRRSVRDLHDDDRRSRTSIQFRLPLRSLPAGVFRARGQRSHADGKDHGALHRRAARADSRHRPGWAGMGG